jgi:hypothetical protein
LNQTTKSFYLQKYEKLEGKYFQLLQFVERAAVGERSDGTYNYCRKALEIEAKQLLTDLKK